MIVVKVELWPYGDEAQATELARGEIANVGGTNKRGNYKARFTGTATDKKHTVELQNYPRLSLHVWHLVYRCLHRLLGDS